MYASIAGKMASYVYNTPPVRKRLHPICLRPPRGVILYNKDKFTLNSSKKQVFLLKKMNLPTPDRSARPQPIFKYI